MGQRWRWKREQAQIKCRSAEGLLPSINVCVWADSLIIRMKTLQKVASLKIVHKLPHVPGKLQLRPIFVTVVLQAAGQQDPKKYTPSIACHANDDVNFFQQQRQ